jgi:hypothetical protein
LEDGVDYSIVNGTKGTDDFYSGGTVTLLNTNNTSNLTYTLSEEKPLYVALKSSVPLYLKLKEYLLFVILTVNVLMNPFLNKSFNAILKSLLYNGLCFKLLAQCFFSHIEQANIIITIETGIK